jgi:tRNA(adenine34) deaminase
MIHARIEKLLFAAPDPKSGALGGAYCLPAVHPHNHVLEYRGGLMADDAAAILKAFFRARR